MAIPYELYRRPDRDPNIPWKWGDPTHLLATAQNYFGMQWVPKCIPNPLSKRFVEGDLLEGLPPELELATREALVTSKLIIRGMKVTNPNSFPIENAVLHVEPFPVAATVAGPMADGVSHGDEPSVHARSYRIAAVYPRNFPGSALYFILYSRSDGIYDGLISVRAPPFQTAAQLVSGWGSPIAATIVVFLAIIVWFTLWGGICERR